MLAEVLQRWEWEGGGGVEVNRRQEKQRPIAPGQSLARAVHVMFFAL
jgi:hypothetical protein